MSVAYRPHPSTLSSPGSDEELRASAARYHRLVTRMTALVFELDPAGKLCYANEALAAMTGYALAELLGHNWWDLIVAPDRSVVAELVELLHQQDVSGYELALAARDGALIWLELSTANHYGPDGRLLGIVGFALNRTRRKELEAERDKALRELNERVKELSGLHKAMQLLQDTTWPLTEVLPKLAALLPPAFQCPAAAAARIVVDDQVYTTPNFAESTATLSTVLSDADQIISIEVCYLNECPHCDEGPFLIEERNFITTIAEMLRAYLTRRRAEDQRRASDERFRTLVNSMDDIVYTLDRAGRHTGVYGRWVERAGLTADHFLGRTARQVLGAAEAQLHEVANAQALRGENVTYEWSVDTDDGPRHYQTSLSPLRDADGQISGVVGVGRNITAHKCAEEALRKSAEKWRSLFTILPVGVSILDQHNRISDMNLALEKILGITHQGLLEGDYKQRRYLAADGSPLRHEEFPSTRAVREQRIIEHVEIGVVKEDSETIWTEVSAAPLPFPDAVCVIVTSDITDRKRLTARE